MALQLILPPHAITPDVDVAAYADASGPADKNRWWGIVVAQGASQKRDLLTGLKRLRRRYPNDLDPKTKEPKRLPTAGIADAITWLQKRRYLHFYYRIPSFDDPSLSWIPDHLVRMITGLKPHRVQRDGKRIEHFQQRALRYIRDTNDNLKNKHKLISLLVISNNLADRLSATGLGPRIRSLTLYADDEQFRLPRECAWAVKWFLAAVLQGAGMSNKLNGNAPYESSFRGNVRVRTNCPSHRFAGIQFADVVARAASRGIIDMLP